MFWPSQLKWLKLTYIETNLTSLSGDLERSLYSSNSPGDGTAREINFDLVITDLQGTYVLFLYMTKIDERGRMQSKP